MANKENERFPSLSSEEMKKLSTKYVPGNTEKMTKWLLNMYTSSAWRDVHNKKFSADQCPLNIFNNCKAATLNKWLARFVAEARKEDGSPYPPKTIQALLTGLLRHARASTGKEPPNFLQKDDLHFKLLYNAIDNVYRNLLGQGIGIQTNSAATLTKEELGTLWSKGVLGTHSPLSLLQSVFFVFGMHACLRGSKEH